MPDKNKKSNLTKLDDSSLDMITGGTGYTQSYKLDNLKEADDKQIKEHTETEKIPFSQGSLTDQFESFTKHNKT